MADKALANLKVLDLSHYVAGPYCTRILAGFGANVIKVEKPPGGDPARRIGPFLGDEPGPERSVLFLYLNSTKKSITLNLKSPAGLKIMRDLLKDADVLVESFKPGTMSRLGLSYEAVRTLNPRLVMTSVSNFGQTGPYRDYKTSHLVTWGMGIGLYTPDGYGARPLQMGGWVTHYVAGLFAAAATAAAVFQRNKTDNGQHVDTSMQESIMMMTTFPSVVYSYTGLVHHDIGGKGLGVMTTKDGGYIGPNAWTRPQIERMFALLGVPEMAQDPRFQESTWVANREEAKEILKNRIKEWNSRELFEKAVEWNVPIAMLPTTKDILESPQHQARGFFEEVEHPVIGKATMPGAPFKMMLTPWKTESPAPLLGQHNTEVICNGLGYTRDDLERLREQGVI
ncbi:MAG: CoA transferase [Dehalococcoidia bacterium]|nr:CoA transferase [Dehalococcoidia bacterium]